jgi:nicotinate-nucleotide adenylyltransferase
MSDEQFTAVYGGSYDPPTLGHLMVVSHLLLNAPNVQRIYIPPCFQQRGKNLSSFEHRLIMCERNFGILPRVKILRIEEELGGESLTIRMLRELRKNEPNTKFRFVMGADLIDTAPSWEGWDEIQMIAPPLIIGRAGISPRRPEDPTPVAPLVSSTIVREALASGDYQEAGRYLTNGVCKYIQDNRLYLKT